MSTIVMNDTQSRWTEIWTAWIPRALVAALLAACALGASGCCGGCGGCSERITMFEKGNSASSRFVVQDIDDPPPRLYLGVGRVHDYWISDAELLDDHKPAPLEDVRTEPEGIVEVKRVATSSIVLLGLNAGKATVRFRGRADGVDIDDSFEVAVADLENLVFEQHELSGRNFISVGDWNSEVTEITCTHRALARFDAEAPIIMWGQSFERIIGVGALPLKLTGGRDHVVLGEPGQPEHVRLRLGPSPGPFELVSSRFGGHHKATRFPMIAEDPARVNGQTWVHSRPRLVHRDDQHINPRKTSERDLGLVRVLPTIDGEPLCGALVPARARITTPETCKVAPHRPGEQVAFVEEAASPDGYFTLKSTGPEPCGAEFELILGDEVIRGGEPLEIEVVEPSGGGGWDWD